LVTMNVNHIRIRERNLEGSHVFDTIVKKMESEKTENYVAEKLSLKHIKLYFLVRQSIISHREKLQDKNYRGKKDEDE
jgi:hypothetical protein